MESNSYETFKRDYLKLAGIDLNSYKENQMKRRIDNFIRKQKIATYGEFIQLIKRDKSIYDRFITYLTINVSEFYRNPIQWKVLEEIIFPSLLKKFGRPLRIWSAACSTGDEPYSLAMVLSEILPLTQFKIIATDLDNEVLEKAKKGYYTKNSIKGLPEKFQEKYIESCPDGIVKVSDRLKSCITFRQHNLLEDEYPRDMHLIVCRNVMIYFTDDAKRKMYHKFTDSLMEQGILFVGSTEQIIGPEQYRLQGVKSFFYEKNSKL